MSNPTELHTLIARFENVQVALADLAWITNPQCGKRGKGFKAAKKAKHLLSSPRQELADSTDAIKRWIDRDRKASFKERQSRTQRVKELLPNWE